MRKLINPPIQGVLLLGGVALLGLSAWSLLDLKLKDETQAKAAADVSVQIPDAKVLDAPALDKYAKMVQAPLFWAARKEVEVPKAAVVAEPVVPLDTSLPEGRLIGIIDVGDHLFGVMQNGEGKSTHLRNGDSWGAWKVSGIDPDRLILTQGSEKQEIALVGDFAAPQANPQLAKMQAAQQQAKKQAKQPSQQLAHAAPAQVPVVPGQKAALTPPPVVATPPALPEGSTPSMPDPAQAAGLPFPADTAKQPPALSVKDALEARQRLMAARWGSLSGDAAPAAAGQ